MRIGMVSLIALAALAAGCTKVDDGGGSPSGGSTTPAPTPTPTGPGMAEFKALYALPNCPTDLGDPVKLVNIVLPKTFDGKKIARDVNEGAATGNGKGSSNPNAGSKNAPNKPQPFDVFVKFAAQPTGVEFPTKGLVLVRALLIKGTDFHFHDDATNMFHGIAANDPNQTIICGAEVIKTPTDDATASPTSSPAPGGQGGGQGNDKASEIALFYVNLGELDKAPSVDFTIALEAGSGGDMVKLLIDPKIMNDGGGMRNGPQ